MVLFGYGVFNALLYAGLLPLWDGFDEPFHYGYVQQLRRQCRPLVFGRTTLSSEVWDSLALAPGSYLVKRNVSRVIAFNEYFALSESKRVQLRRQLEHLDPQTANQSSGSPNYEAQQTPLAYSILAIFDFVWRRISLLRRVLLLRLVCAIASSIAAGILTLKLARQLGLSERWGLSAVYLVFSSQMFYASTAHVANDWLSIPLFTLLIVVAISLQRNPKTATAGLFFVTLAAGLLTKAYFLALIPFAGFFVGWLCWTGRLSVSRVALIATVPLTIVGGWYQRNIALYHDLSGMQQTIGGRVAISQLVRALFGLPWIRMIDATLTTSIWTGNNSATTFNSKTVHFVLLLWLMAAGLYLRATMGRRVRAAEALVIIVFLSYALGLLYDTVLLYSLTGGTLLSPPPWYVQVLLPPSVCLAMVGVAQARRVGEMIRIALLSSAYMISVTYLAKLIPLYAGYTAQKSHLLELVSWYMRSFDWICRTLSMTAMLPSPILCLLVGIVIGAAISIAIVLAVAPISFSANPD
jgi:hypothetical protein